MVQFPLHDEKVWRDGSAEAARQLEIGQNLLRKWRDQLAEEGSQAFSAKA